MHCLGVQEGMGLWILAKGTRNRGLKADLHRVYGECYIFGMIPDSPIAKTAFGAHQMLFIRLQSCKPVPRLGALFFLLFPLVCEAVAAFDAIHLPMVSRCRVCLRVMYVLEATMSRATHLRWGGTSPPPLHECFSTGRCSCHDYRRKAQIRP